MPTAITLRALTTNDLTTLWQKAYAGDGEWMRWDGPYFNDPIPTLDEFIESQSRAINSPYQALIMHDDELIGSVNAYWKDGSLRQWLEVGLVIFNSEDWQKGYGTQALKLWVAQQFANDPELVRVGLTTWSGNCAMMHLAQKLGMKEEAHFRKVRVVDDKYYDSVSYGVLREEWQIEY